MHAWRACIPPPRPLPAPACAAAASCAPPLVLQGLRHPPRAAHPTRPTCIQACMSATAPTRLGKPTWETQLSSSDQQNVSSAEYQIKYDFRGLSFKRVDGTIQAIRHPLVAVSPARVRSHPPPHPPPTLTTRDIRNFWVLFLAFWSKQL